MTQAVCRCRSDSTYAPLTISGCYLLSKHIFDFNYAVKIPIVVIIVTIILYSTWNDVCLSHLFRNKIYFKIMFYVLNYLLTHVLVVCINVSSSVHFMKCNTGVPQYNLSSSSCISYLILFYIIYKARISYNAVMKGFELPISDLGLTWAKHKHFHNTICLSLT